MIRRKNISHYKYVFLYKLSFILFVLLNCATRIISPHAQNEMLAPYNLGAQKHEFGGAFAYNGWVVDRSKDVTYDKTYPTGSFSFYYNTSTKGKIAWLGGIELISASLEWTDHNMSNYVVYLRPYLGLQLNGSVITLRLNFSPLIIGGTLGDDEWTTGSELAEFTRYQFTCLLHNPQPAPHILYGGIRFAHRTIGSVLGYEFAFTKNSFLRTEYSYLNPAPFSDLGIDDDNVAVKGSVHYLTVGIFERLK